MCIRCTWCSSYYIHVALQNNTAAVLFSITTNLNRVCVAGRERYSLRGCYVNSTTNITALLTTICLCKCTIVLCWLSRKAMPGHTRQPLCPAWSSLSGHGAVLVFGWWLTVLSFLEVVSMCTRILHVVDDPYPLTYMGCGQFHTDILAHVGFKHILSCWKRHLHLWYVTHCRSLCASRIPPKKEVLLSPTPKYLQKFLKFLRFSSQHIITALTVLC